MVPETPVDPTDALSAYAQALQSSTTGERFALSYIDEDEIPELFIFDGDFHFSAPEIYTYVNGTIINLGRYGSNGSVTVAKKQNLLCSFYGGMGNMDYSYYTLQDGAAVLVQSIGYYVEYSGTEKTTYNIDEVQVSEAEYQQAEEWYESQYAWTELHYGDSFDISADHIEAMQRQYGQYLK